MKRSSTFRNKMHDEISKFSLDGEINDTSNIVQQKERLVNFLETQMRDEGCVPALDLEPQFTLDYNRESETYNFTLSVYGIEIGKEEVWQTAGVMGGKMIMKSTHPVK